MWATGSEGTAGREGGRGWEKEAHQVIDEKETLEVPSKKPRKKNKLICEIKGERQFGQIKATNLKREQGTKNKEEED